MHVFHVPDLKCGGCLGFVARALRDIDQTVRITADIPARTLRVISTRFGPPSCAPCGRPGIRPNQFSSRSGEPGGPNLVESSRP